MIFAYHLDFVLKVFRNWHEPKTLFKCSPKKTGRPRLRDRPDSVNIQFYSSTSDATVSGVSSSLTVYTEALPYKSKEIFSVMDAFACQKAFGSTLSNSTVSVRGLLKSRGISGNNTLIPCIL